MQIFYLAEAIVQIFKMRESRLHIEHLCPDIIPYFLIH